MQERDLQKVRCRLCGRRMVVPPESSAVFYDLLLDYCNRWSTVNAAYPVHKSLYLKLHTERDDHQTIRDSTVACQSAGTCPPAGTCC
jgi:hypothetical protein